ncbi:dienelactone hydrolase family protein [uncultured Paracoccus sp.]|uniref:alpha/beta hydrolase n=1 Tax=uncultured Paracoccus sp. TaxID=189685 RepID=UPI0025F84465|nr:dienelactone hydrolase family protein [uncultured Paracoccus sp.]
MLTLLAFHGSGRDDTDLIAFAQYVAPSCPIVAPLGDFADGDGYTFFRRRPDRSIPVAQVVTEARQWLSRNAPLLPPLGERIVLVGYSSGAIFAEAMLSVCPDRWAGAILLRPEPLAEEFIFPPMVGKPILILAGRHDTRRRTGDAARLAGQFDTAGAGVTLHILDTGHGWADGNQDAVLARAWLGDVGIG